MIYIDTKEKYEEATEYLLKQKILAVDTETTGLDVFTSQLLLLQIGNEYRQYVFDVIRLTKNKVDFYKLAIVLENPVTKKVGHNLVFDYKVLKHHLGIELTNIFDTMITEMLLTKGLKLKGFGLEDVLKKYSIVKELPKEIRETFEYHIPGSDFIKDQLIYAAEDIKYLLPLARAIQTLLIRDNMGELAKLENETVLVTGDLELNGIYLDKNSWQKLENLAINKRQKAKEKLLKYLPDNFDPVMVLPEKKREKILKKQEKQEKLGLDFDKIQFDINFSSPIQMKPFIKMVTGKEPKDTNENTLFKLYRQPDGTLIPVIKDLLDYREADKQATTYGMEFYNKNINKLTERIHSEFKQLGADSGRYSSKNPNLQNIPGLPQYRAAFKPQSSDYKFICADLSQFELRILAELSQEKSWIDVLQDPDGDLHRFVASRLYNLPESEIHKELRTVGKKINFGVGYGAGARRLQDEINKAFSELGIEKEITFEDAKSALNTYNSKFARVRVTLDKAVIDARRREYAYSSLDGRRRYLKIDWDDYGLANHAGNIAKNQLCQGPNASVTKKAMCEIRKRIKELRLDAKIVNTIHDEIIVEVLASQAEQCRKMVEEEFITAGKHYLKIVPVAVECVISDYWRK